MYARLVYQLEKSRCIPLFQSRFRKGRSTLDNSIKLELVWRNHLVSIFFDIEKAYDRTWRYGILHTLFNFGLRGNLPTFIKKILKLRTFRVRLDGTLSAPFTQAEGVLQGSILSVTLFICHISPILNVFSPSIQASLYVDNLQISCEVSDMRIIERQYQTAVNNIVKWCDSNGYSISASKSCCVHFCRKRGIHPDPEIRICDVQIPVVSDVRFLGVIFDRRLTFLPHILQLRTSGQYSSYSTIYTDGSKCADYVGCGVVIEDFMHGYRLDTSCSVFTNEAVAIYRALQLIDSNMPRKYCIYTDSMSVLNALENYNDRCHPVVCKILDITSRLYCKGFDIVFCWLPSHVGNFPQNIFICSKSRVAPLKSLTLPRLELTAALLSARLAKQVSSCLKFDTNIYIIGPILSFRTTGSVAILQRSNHTLKIVFKRYNRSLIRSSGDTVQERTNLISFCVVNLPSNSELRSEELEHRSSVHVAVIQQREALVDINRFSSLKKLENDCLDFPIREQC
ncbi:putative RNA-directed DNA polymerase from transposon X-element [Trichonephila clavipes]|nr:putative RNA-directed DNA polymerase from transposon X-element [Trichonephila clavipes]